MTPAPLTSVHVVPNVSRETAAGSESAGPAPGCGSTTRCPPEPLPPPPPSPRGKPPVGRPSQPVTSLWRRTGRTRLTTAAGQGGLVSGDWPLGSPSPEGLRASLSWDAPGSLPRLRLPRSPRWVLPPGFLPLRPGDSLGPQRGVAAAQCRAQRPRSGAAVPAAFASRDQVLVLAKVCLPCSCVCVCLSLGVPSRVTRRCGEGTQALPDTPLLEGGAGGARGAAPAGRALGGGVLACSGLGDGTGTLLVSSEPRGRGEGPHVTDAPRDLARPGRGNRAPPSPHEARHLWASPR